MKKITLIFALLISLSVQSQVNIPIDTTPRYDFMFILASQQDFNTAERLIYQALINDDNMNASSWCKETKDSIGNYACEVPSVDRIVKIKEIAPILPYLSAIIEDVSKLEFYKQQMISTDIPNQWKWLIGRLYIVNRNLYK